MLEFLIYMLICSVFVSFSYFYLFKKLKLNTTEKEMKLIVFLFSCIVGLAWPIYIFILFIFFLINFFIKT